MLYRHRLDAQDQCDLDDCLAIDPVPPEYFLLQSGKHFKGDAVSPR